MHQNLSYRGVQRGEENKGRDCHDGGGDEALEGGDRSIERDSRGTNAVPAPVVKLPQDDGHGQETARRSGSSHPCFLLHD